MLVLSLGACASTTKPPGHPQDLGAADDGHAAADVDESALRSWPVARDRYLEESFARGPVGATLAGRHEWDANWPDLSAEGRRAHAEWLATWAERFAKVETPASIDDVVDLGILRDAIALEQLVLEQEDPWQTNPLAWVGLVGSGLDALVVREFAPAPTRMASLAARLDGVPTLVREAKLALAETAKLRAPHTKVAIAQIDGLLVLLDEEIPRVAATVDDTLRAKVDASRGKARAAILELKSHLETKLPDARGEWRLGAAAFDRKLRLVLGVDTTAADVRALAELEHGRVRAEMATLARALYPVLFPKRGRSAVAPATDDELVRVVLEALAVEHVAPEQLREACEENLVRLQTFVSERKLVPTDPNERVEVIWTPAHQRGVAIAGLDAPPPLEPVAGDLPSFYLVQPLPDAWDEATKRSFLREYNHFMLEVLSIHEAIPGHFVQLYWGRRDPSVVRRVYSNGAFVEGWAVYAERIMVEAGYAGAPSRFSPAEGPRSKGLQRVMASDELRAKAIALHRAKFYLRTVTNAILDHDIHAGAMTQEQAVSFMVERAFQQRGEAEGKWVRAQLSSGQLSTYFVGASAWFSLRAAAEAKALQDGTPFDADRFHREALAHGAPPLKTLTALMAE